MAKITTGQTTFTASVRATDRTTYVKQIRVGTPISAVTPYEYQQDANFITNLIDSSYVKAFIDPAYVQSVQADIYRDSSYITEIVDSAYIQARQLKPYIDSATAADIADSVIANTNINADTLDGIHASSFVRNDNGGVTNGPLRFNDNVKLTFGSVNDSDTDIEFNGTNFSIINNSQGSKTNIIAERLDLGKRNDAQLRLAEEILVARSLIPDNNNEHDLGSPNVRWRDLYMSGNSIYLGNIKLSEENGVFKVTNQNTGIVTTFAELFDDSDVLALIDSDYITARASTYDSDNARKQIEAYGYATENYVDAAVNNLIDGAPGTLDTLNEIAAALNDNDSAYATLVRMINDQLDSNEVIDLVDSNYVRARQDYAYASLTGVPTNLSQFNNNTNYLDSTTVQGVIDAAYVQANQITYDFLDSSEAISLIDSAYVQARQITYDFLDSAEVINLVDSAYVQARVDTTDSAQVINLIVATVDSAYVRSRQDYAYNSLTGAPTTLSSFDNDTNYLDSSAVTDLVDSAYISARVDAAIIQDQNYIDSTTAEIIFDNKFSTKSTSELTEGGNLYYTTARFDSDLSTERSQVRIRQYFSAAGDLSYDYETGIFQFNVENIYTQNNFDSDLNTALDSATINGTGLNWNSANNTLNISATGVDSGTYGSATEIPVFTVNPQGQIDSIGTIKVAGVSSTAYDSVTGVLTINTADGGSFNTTLHDSSDRIAEIRGAINGSGDLSYDVNTGVFSINVEEIYTQANFDSDLNKSSTSNLPEGNNLYYTTTRVDSAFDARFLTKTTDSLSEGSNLYYTTARADSDFDARLSTKTTSDLSEGNNLYYTTDRFDSDFDLTFPSAFDLRLGNISTDDLSEGDNKFYTQDRVDSDIRTLIGVSGNGLVWDSTNTTLSLDSAAHVYVGDLTVTNDVVVEGNLQVNGTTATVNATNLEVSDNMIYMNAAESSGSPTQSIDIGFVGNYNDIGSYAHTGLFRDATDGKWKLFQGYTPEPDANVQLNTGHASFEYAPLQVSRIIGVYDGFDSDFNAALDNAGIDGVGLTYDGSTNTLSITNTGVDSGTYGSTTQIPVFTVNAQGQIDSITTVTVAGVTGFEYDSATGNLIISTADGSTFTDSINLNPFTTDDLTEGNNLYYTSARVDSAIRDSIFTDNLVAVNATIDSAYITNLKSDNIRLDTTSIGQLTVDSTFTTQLNVVTGDIDTLTSTDVTIDSAYITNLNVIDAKLDTLNLNDQDIDSNWVKSVAFGNDEPLWLNPNKSNGGFHLKTAGPNRAYINAGTPMMVTSPNLWMRSNYPRIFSRSDSSYIWYQASTLGTEIRHNAQNIGIDVNASGVTIHDKLVTDTHVRIPAAGQLLLADSTNVINDFATLSRSKNVFKPKGQTTLKDFSGEVLVTGQEVKLTAASDIILDNYNGGSILLTSDSVIDMNGVLTIDNTNTIVKADVLPAADSTYSLGDSDTRFKDLYLSGSTLSLGNQKLKTYEQGTRLTHGTSNNTGTLYAAMPVYDSVGALPPTYKAGEQAFIPNTGRLYISNGSGWYNVALINAAPMLTNVVSSYRNDSYGSISNNTYLAPIDGTDFIITIIASDSDGNALTYSATLDNNAQNVFSVVQDSSKFTFSPITEDSSESLGYSGGYVTFSVTDGIDVANTNSLFFKLNIQYLDWSQSSIEQKILNPTQDANYNQEMREAHGSLILNPVNSVPEITFADINYNAGANQAGRVYRYERNMSTGVWTLAQTIGAPTASPNQTASFFGNTCQMSDDGWLLFVARPGWDYSSTILNSGAVHVYKRNSTTRQFYIADVQRDAGQNAGVYDHLWLQNTISGKYNFIRRFTTSAPHSSFFSVCGKYRTSATEGEKTVIQFYKTSNKSITGWDYECASTLRVDSTDAQYQPTGAPTSLMEGLKNFNYRDGPSDKAGHYYGHKFMQCKDDINEYQLLVADALYDIYDSTGTVVTDQGAIFYARARSGDTVDGAWTPKQCITIPISKLDANKTLFEAIRWDAQGNTIVSSDQVGNICTWVKDSDDGYYRYLGEVSPPSYPLFTDGFRVGRRVTLDKSEKVMIEMSESQVIGQAGYWLGIWERSSFDTADWVRKRVFWADSADIGYPLQNSIPVVGEGYVGFAEPFTQINSQPDGAGYIISAPVTQG